MAAAANGGQRCAIDRVTARTMTIRHRCSDIFRRDLLRSAFFLTASFTPPMAFWILPVTLSPLPSLFIFSSPRTSPAFSFTSPLIFAAAFHPILVHCSLLLQISRT